MIHTVAKKAIYSSVPYMSARHNKMFKDNVLKLVAEFFPHIKLNIIFKSTFTISSMFPFKDPVPKNVRSNIVYSYQCGMCDSTYIGESSRHYHTRVSEHQGVSPRTGKPSTNSRSNIYQHYMDTGHPVKEQNFKILSSTHPWDLCVSESIEIHVQKPDLNDKISSANLNIV